MEDGTTIAVADPEANYLRWRMEFHDLSDLESASLVNFFTVTHGNQRTFTFLDPTANLLQASEDFSSSAWTSRGLAFDAAVADPLGTTKASRVLNNSPTTQTLGQATQVPGLAQACFSVYLWSANPTSVTLTRSAGTQSQSVAAAVTAVWQRFSLSGSLAAAPDNSTFGIAFPAGAAVEVLGPQVDAQVTPSTYVMSTGQSGVYTNARFDMPQLDVIATGPNRSACVVYVRVNLTNGESL
jgi:hypothetical protein